MDADVLASLTDDELEAAFRRTTMQPGDPEADAIVAEQDRRRTRH